jgi:hypothetical protein
MRILLGDEDGTEQDTLEFQLKVKCSWIPNSPKDSTNPADNYKDHKSECYCYVRENSLALVLKRTVSTE